MPRTSISHRCGPNFSEQDKLAFGLEIGHLYMSNYVQEAGISGNDK